MDMDYLRKIARILRTDKDVIYFLEAYLGKLSKKSKVIEAIAKENEERIKQVLADLNLSFSASAKEVYQALITRLEKDDASLNRAMNYPDCHLHQGCLDIVSYLEKSFSFPDGFFLKKESFIRILEAQPPQKLLEVLGLNSVTQMFERYDWKEIGAALRFVEGGDWINQKLLPHYLSLSPSDFEERKIEIITLDQRWQEIATSFMKKKYHNISHLKELGVIFILPTKIEAKGQLMRTVALLIHYLNEVSFYSELFKKAALQPEKVFADILSSLIRGDVIDDRNAVKDNHWLIIQRYLAKDDENDWRLSFPHVNPEALHWEKAERGISLLGNSLGLKNFDFWQDLNWVGDYFVTETGVEVLVSFNLVDITMSLVQNKEMVKYLYHHQESLWNKIFASFVGWEKMEELIKENLIKGYLDPENIWSK